MAILTEDDILTYAPSVTLTGDALTGAIAFIQSVIESDQGANRPLEITEFTQKLNINLKFSSFHLTYAPLVNPPDPVIKLRIGGNTIDGFRRGIPAGTWQTITADQYTIDSDGQVNIFPSAFSFWSDGSGYGYRHTQVMFTTAEVTYSAGLNFTEDTTEIKGLKAAVGQILTYTQNSGMFKGVEELQIPFNEYRIKYSSMGAMVGNIPTSLLSAFKKYRPKGF